MARYKNMFYDDNLGKLVYVNLDSEDMIVRQEETGEESQAVEFDIKNGYVNNYGYQTQAMVNAPLIYELPNSRGYMEDDIAEIIHTDSQLGGMFHNRTAFQGLFNNFIYTCEVAREHTRHHYTRHRYKITAGMVVKYSRDSRGLTIKHVLLGDDGRLDTTTPSYSVLSNIYSGGDTCHWGLTEVSRWRMNAGKSDGHPDTLAKSYEVFKAGIGNNDLTSSNSGVQIENRELVEILQEFDREYVDTIQHRGMRRNMKSYVRSYIDKLEEQGGDNYHTYNANQLSSILEKTPNFYVEDYL